MKSHADAGVAPVDFMKDTRGTHAKHTAEHRWMEISVVLDKHLQDAVANFFMELGADGVVTDGEISDAPPGTPSATARAQSRLTAYLKDSGEVNTHLDALHRYLKALAEIHSLDETPQVACKLIHEEDWSRQWQRHFSTVRIGKRLVIKPSWETYHALIDDIVIEMDPGMAFGTGAHPTTRMCLEVIEDLVCRSARPPRSMLDVGTGSGILSIAAAKLGIEKIVAIDIDPIALSYAGKNAALNRVAHRLEIRNQPLERIDERFDLIAANILSHTLLKLRGELMKHLHAGGTLVLSGILAEEAHKLETAFSSKKHPLLDSILQGEWACLVLQK